MSFVVDASALVWAMTEQAPAATALRGRLVAEEVHAPHLLDAEAGNVLRRLVLRGQLSDPDGRVLLDDAATLVDHRYDHRGALATLAWQLLHRVTFYDGLYVALAASLGVELVTADARLASAPRLPCSTTLV
jgi:predicted nucleic acid-binding protein